jgi:hypothetical protein
VTPTPAPPHPIDLLVENHSDDQHRLTVRIEESSGTVVLAETFTLDAHEQETVTDVLPVPTDGQAVYRFSAGLEDGSRTVETVTVGPVHEIHLLAVFVTTAGEVAIDRQYH